MAEHRVVVVNIVVVVTVVSVVVVCVCVSDVDDTLVTVVDDDDCVVDVLVDDVAPGIVVRVVVVTVDSDDVNVVADETVVVDTVTLVVVGTDTTHPHRHSLFSSINVYTSVPGRHRHISAAPVQSSNFVDVVLVRVAYVVVDVDTVVVVSVDDVRGSHIVNSRSPVRPPVMHCMIVRLHPQPACSAHTCPHMCALHGSDCAFATAASTATHIHARIVRWCHVFFMTALRDDHPKLIISVLVLICVYAASYSHWIIPCVVWGSKYGCVQTFRFISGGACV